MVQHTRSHLLNGCDHVEPIDEPFVVPHRAWEGSVSGYAPRASFDADVITHLELRVHDPVHGVGFKEHVASAIHLAAVTDPLDVLEILVRYKQVVFAFEVTRQNPDLLLVGIPVAPVNVTDLAWRKAVNSLPTSARIPAPVHGYGIALAVPAVLAKENNALIDYRDRLMKHIPALL